MNAGVPFGSPTSSCHAGSWVWVATTQGITTFSAAGAARALQQAVFIRVANRTLENPYGAPQLEILRK